MTAPNPTATAPPPGTEEDGLTPAIAQAGPVASPPAVPQGTLNGGRRLTQLWICHAVRVTL